MPKVKRSDKPRNVAYACATPAGHVFQTRTWRECQEIMRQHDCAHGRGFADEMDMIRWCRRYRTLAQSDESADVVTVYTDGSLMGGAGGVGVYWGDGDARNVSERLDEREHPPTNNRAELTALIRAYEAWERRDDEDRAKHLLIRSDSKYSIMSTLHYWADWLADGSHAERLNADLIARVYELHERNRATVTVEYVRAHCGIPGNEAADKLAKAGSAKKFTE